MCPQCGCPGEAIAEYVAQLSVLADTNVPPERCSPVVRVASASSQGYGVAIKSGGMHYVVLETSLLGDASSLALTSLSGDPVSYAKPELSECQRLVRFSSTSTNVSFAAVEIGAALGDRYLWQDGGVVLCNEKSALGMPVALCSAATNVVAVQVSAGKESVLLQSRTWRCITPRELKSMLSKHRGDSE